MSDARFGADEPLIQSEAAQVGPPLRWGLADVRRIGRLCIAIAVALAVAVRGGVWIRDESGSGGKGGGEAWLWGIGLDIRKGAVRLRGVADLGVRFGGLSLEYGHGAFERFPGDLHPDSGQSF
ncbi:hypothetical protein [Streptomyces sp. NRRL S-337]|uniref:hypothetical protein n=1 Tax=Streptomyces sp. NRRL S-337 TaxID=1463900 RepID=UPI00131BA1D1|nr:hypothetical protein [Streptomyces sp. NRRL S-337]